MKKSVRVASVVLCLFLVSGMMTSCRKTSKEKNATVNTTVTKEDPWFDSARFTLQMEKSATDMLMTNTAAEYINGKIYSTYATYDLDTSEEKVKLDVYSEQGTKEKALEIKFPDEDKQVQEIYSLIPSEDGKTATALVAVFNGGFETDFVKVDLETGVASDMTPLLDKNGQAVPFITSATCVGRYTAIQGTDLGTGETLLLFYEGMKLICEMDMSTLSGPCNIDAFSYNEKTKKAYANVEMMSGEKYTCELDLSSGQFTNKTPWVTGGDNADTLTDYQCTPQGDLLRVDTLGNIFKYNVETNTEEKVLDNNWYSPYFYDFNPDKNTDIRVIHFSDEKIVLYFYGDDGFPTARILPENFTILVLTKASSNPHEGKKVIEISAPLDGSFSDYLSQAIVSFNAEDPEYIIRIWGKYNEGIRAGRGFAILDPEIERAYTLVRELESDDCPDIVVNMDKKEAMNDKTLVDLSSFVEEDVKQNLFGNILEASKVDGKLYFIPVTIEVEGLIVKEDDVGKDKVGMTFEEYDSYVSGKLSGAQPYDYPESEYYYRDIFLMSCIDIKSAVEGEKVNFESEQFRKAAEYAKANFPENRRDPDEFIPFAEEELRPEPDGRYVHMTNYVDYVKNCANGQDAFSVIGTPSVSAQGPRFKAQESISVTARSDRQDGCKKFINYLLSGKFVSGDLLSFASLCINKEVMKTEIALLSQYYNEIYAFEMDYGLFDKSQLKTMGFKESTDTMQQKFFDMLSTLSVYYMDDKEIRNIINEEMAAYYAGDKSMDDVIRFLNDRVDKYISEAK
ncbi:MAG: extracellular solute-binding protein [Clostridiales bacterium]|nr:extracellular solute-binding protein [Clostridiales bacterium]